MTLCISARVCSHRRRNDTTPAQREAALRLADELGRIGEHGAGSQITTTGEVWHPANTMLPAAALLRELAAEETASPQVEHIRQINDSAESEQEPVIDGYPLLQGIPPPAQRQPLTEAQIDAVYRQFGTGRPDGFLAAARAVERAHGIGDAA